MTKWLLLGLPNVGKSTIFNRLTNKKVHVGNWSGVTVDVTRATLHLGGQSVEIVDLPGMYGLKPYSNEERVGVDFLLSSVDRLVINVLSCFDLERGIRQTLALKELGYVVVVVLNFWEQATKKGAEIDKGTLSKELGCPVVINEKRANLAHEIFTSIPSDYTASIDYLPKTLEDSIKKSRTHADKYQLILDWEKQGDNLDQLYLSRAIQTNKIIGSCVKTPNKKEKLLHPSVILLLFVLCVGGAFWITFGPVGNYIKSLIETVLECCTDFLCRGLNYLGCPSWIMSFVDEVIVSGVCSVLGFLPQIALLFTFVSILEQSGLLSRFVWLCAPLCYRLKLSGKSIFPLLMGVGCNTTAIPLTQGIKDDGLRKKTIFLLPFVPCSAKLPVLALFGSVFFGKWAFLIILLFFVLSVIIGVVSVNIGSTNPDIFDAWEYNRLQFPSVKLVLSNVWQNAVRFLAKIWKVLLIFAMILWLMIHFSLRLEYLPTMNENSILCAFSQSIAPVFKPLGLDWGAVCALFIGLPAKELSLLGLAMINGTEEGSLGATLTTGIVSFDLLSAITFLTFFMLYAPCVSSMVQAKAYTSTKFVIWLIVAQFVIAYIVSWFVHSCVKCVLLNGINLLLWTVLFAVLVLIFTAYILRQVRKNKCKFCSHCSRWNQEY